MKTNMIKVLFLSQWYPNRYDLMAGLFVQKHAEAVSLYCDVASLYIQPDTTIKKTEIITSSENSFLEVIVYFPAKSDSIIAKLLKQINYLKAYKLGYKVILDSWGKPDIVQANVFTRTVLIAALLKKRYSIPYVVIEHWTRYFRENMFKNKIHRFFSIYAAKHASAIMPVTKHLQGCMELHGMKNHNYNIINNVVDDIFFEKLVIPDNKKIRILNVTCFDDQQKNLSGLLHVIKKLSLKRLDFEIYLVGDGIDYSKIKSLAGKLEIENTFVYFTGILTGKELVEMYQKSHFTVLFSNYENMPVVISESLSCGLPVVSTNVGGIAEHINSANGLLINAGDEHGLYTSLDYMINHYLDYNKNDIIENAKQKFSYQSVGKNLVSIYYDIINNN